MSKDVTVVIVTHNSGAVVKDLVASIPGALGSLSAHITVVDNASTDDTREVLASLNNISVVLAVNLGYAAGINAGVRASPPDSKSILILNPDVILGPSCVELMFRMLHDPTVGIVAPRITDSQGKMASSLRRRPSIPRAMGLGFTRLAVFSERMTLASDYRESHAVDWATGAVLLVRRSCYTDLGGWDESFFLYSEETEFCLRARDRGWLTVYTPDATSTHHEGGSGRSARTESMLALNRVRLYWRSHSRNAARAYFALTVIAEASRVVRGRRNAQDVLGALVHRDRRPAELGLADTLVPQDANARWDVQTVTGDRTSTISACAKVAAVVIPAHNEERTIARLLRQLVVPDLDITVVSNGSTDGTADLVRNLFPEVTLLESEKPSKRAALRMGDGAAPALPRVFIDADVEIAAEDVRRLVRALAGGQLAAAPAREIPRRQASLVVSWYYDVWEQLPQVRNGLFGRGVIAVAQEGMSRVRAAPPLMSDDLVVSEVFAESERAIVQSARVVIWPPRTSRDLVRRKIRSLTGNHQAAEAGFRSAESRTSTSDLWRIVRQRPLCAPKVAVFAGVWALSKFAASRAIKSGDFTTWRRDESSRT